MATSTIGRDSFGGGFSARYNAPVSEARRRFRCAANMACHGGVYGASVYVMAKPFLSTDISLIAAAVAGASLALLVTAPSGRSDDPSKVEVWGWLFFMSAILVPAAVAVMEIVMRGGADHGDAGSAFGGLIMFVIYSGTRAAFSRAMREWTADGIGR